MSHSPLTLSRRHVLGDLYDRCEAIEGQVPVFLNGEEPGLLGYADESMGIYADAMTFHLADDVCKKLSSGQFTYSIEYEHAGPTIAGSRSRFKLTSITLTALKTYQKQVRTPDAEVANAVKE